MTMMPAAPYRGAAIITLNSADTPIQELRFGSWDDAWIGRDPSLNDKPMDYLIDKDKYRFYIKLTDVFNEYSGKNTLEVDVKAYETSYLSNVTTQKKVTLYKVAGTNTFKSKALLLVSDSRDCIHLPDSLVDRVFHAGLFGKVEITLLNPASDTAPYIAQIWFKQNVKELKVQIMVLKNRFGPACTHIDAKATAAADQFYNARQVYARLGINLIAVDRTNFTPNQLVETRTLRGIGPIYIVHVPNNGVTDTVDCCNLGGNIDDHGDVCAFHNRQGQIVRMFVANDLGTINGRAYPQNYSLPGKTADHNNSFIIGRKNHNVHSFTTAHELGHLLAGNAVHCVDSPNGYDDFDTDWEYRLMRTTSRAAADCTASKWIKDSYIQSWRSSSNHNLF